MKIKHKKNIYGDLRENPQIHTSNFKNWFGSSVVKDSMGRPEIVFHGTFGDFNEFDIRKVSKLSNMGPGFYFTNSADDASYNYADLSGPDPKAKVTGITDYLDANNLFVDMDSSGKKFCVYNDSYGTNKIISPSFDDREDAEEYLKVVSDMGYEPNQDDETHPSHTYQDKAGRMMLDFKHKGAVMPVYLRIENPVVIGGDGATKFLEQDVVDDSYEDYDLGEEIKKLIECLLASWGDISVDPVPEDKIYARFENLIGYGGFSAEEYIKEMYKIEDIPVNRDFDYCLPEIIVDSFKKYGFDGIIDRTVSNKFKKLSYLDSSTAHYIVFNPNQVKSAIGNNGDFSRNSNNISEMRNIKVKSGCKNVSRRNQEN